MKKANSQVKTCAENWSEAYRGDYNGREVSEQIILAMFDAGYTEQEVEWIYRSKHIRWFFDWQGDNVAKSEAYDLFTTYLTKGRNGVKRDVKDWHKNGY